MKSNEKQMDEPNIQDDCQRGYSNKIEISSSDVEESFPEYMEGNH